MTPNTPSIVPPLQPVDQEKLTAPMSHFDSLPEASALAFGCQYRVEKQQRNWPGDRENRPIDLPRAP